MPIVFEEGRRVRKAWTTMRRWDGSYAHFFRTKPDRRRNWLKACMQAVYGGWY